CPTNSRRVRGRKDSCTSPSAACGVRILSSGCFFTLFIALTPSDYGESKLASTDPPLAHPPYAQRSVAVRQHGPRNSRAPDHSPHAPALRQHHAVSPLCVLRFQYDPNQRTPHQQCPVFPHLPLQRVPFPMFLTSALGERGGGHKEAKKKAYL